MTDDYLTTPVALKVKDIPPIYFPLITEIFQRGLDEDAVFPAIFDYRETDRETKETSLKVSFAVTRTGKVLTIAIVKGKARKRILSALADLKTNSQSSGK